MAVGLAMVFGILRLINFAHGDVMMIAAYLAVFCLGAGLPARGAPIPIMVLGTVAVGLLMERIAYRPLRGAPDVAMLLSSFAVGQILQNGTLLTTRLAGMPTLIAFPSPEAAQRRDRARDDHRPQGQRRQLRGRASCCSACCTLFVTRTTLGLSMRAAAEDLTAARLMGIKVNRVVATAFAIGAGLAAVAGFLYAVQAGQINPYMGFTPVLKAFIAAVIGGFGSIAGAVLGGYVLGVPRGPRHGPGRASATCCRRAPCRRRSARFLQTVLPSSLASYRDAVVFIVLILVLLVRPQGILGRRDEGDL